MTIESAAVPVAQSLIPTEGIVQDLPFELYAAEPAINSGMLTMFCREKTPAHIKAKYIDKKVPFDSDDLDFGRNMHAVLLEPKKFMSSHIVIPKFTGKTKDGRESDKSAEARDKKKRWFAQLPPSAIPVEEEDITDFTGMLRQLRDHELINNMLSEGASEITGFWIDKETGVRCKFRADYINMIRHAVVDYKTTRDASNGFFTRQIEKLFYHVQLYHYRTGARALGLPIDDLLMIAQEKTYPYLPNNFFLNELMIEDAEARWRSAMNQLAECMKSGVWPGYPQKVNEVMPTNFLIYREVL